MAYRLECGGRL